MPGAAVSTVPGICFDGSVLIPFHCRKKITDIAMFNAVTAHIKLIEGDDILGKIIPDAVINAKLSADSVFRGQQIADLDINLLIPLFTDKINLLIAGLAYRYGITAAQ